MRIRWSERLRHFIPSPRAMVAAWVGMGLMVMSAACALFYAATAEKGAFLENAGFVFGFIGLPLVALSLGVGALLEKRVISRALMGGVSVLMLAIAALVGGGTYAAFADVPGTEWAMMFCYVPLIFAFSIPLVYSLTKVPRAWRNLIREEREERALAIIRSHGGEATYEELADGLGIPVDEVDAMLSVLLESERLTGRREVRFERFYSTDALEKKHLGLLGMVKTRGQVPLEDLADELRVPEELTKEWIYALVQQGRFTGYINWDDGMLYSAEAEKLRTAGSCPGCGSQMGLGGKGVIRCEHCGLEIFL